MLGSAAEAERRVEYLPALDGLRAIAVLAVLAFHAQVGVEGGFFGVEVFFVLSGFLITSLLIAERNRTGSVSLRGFWLRRARRLLPALCVLFVAVVAVSATVVPDSFASTRGDLVGAIFFVSNWWQIAHHQSYFMAIDRPPLLLHLWSLAIEEQFYLVWPVLFAFVVGGWRPRRLAAVAAAAALASAAWMAALYDPSQDTTGVYYRTDTRLSGLLVGVALAAVLRTARPKDGSGPGVAALDAAALLGFGALAWALLRLRDTDAVSFQGGFLLVDAATAALVVAAAYPATRSARVLGTTPLVWVGKRSYGLYLWHWPIFAVTRPGLDVAWTGAPLLAARLALTFAATEVCYRFVETPVRRGAVLSALRSLAGGGPSAQRARAWRWVGAAALGLALTTALVTAGPVRAAVGDSTRLTRAALDGPPSVPVILTDSVPAPGSETDAAVAGDGPAGDGRGIALDPAWPKTLTLLTDSVTLGVKTALPAAMPGWRVDVIGRPALMVKQAVPEFLK
ncbi:MAG TPA: acyltransferase, partial [Polyangiaceae bacterium]|nr:acyltransferase [Polyangiaceae bacterium]